MIDWLFRKKRVTNACAFLQGKGYKVTEHSYSSWFVKETTGEAVLYNVEPLSVIRYARALGWKP